MSLKRTQDFIGHIHIHFHGTVISVNDIIMVWQTQKEKLVFQSVTGLSPNSSFNLIGVIDFQLLPIHQENVCRLFFPKHNYLS